jgi:hypothetical protein
MLIVSVISVDFTKNSIIRNDKNINFLNNKYENEFKK